MQAKNMQTTMKLSSVVFSTILLTSCGAGSGDQNSVSSLPEVGQATQAAAESTAPIPIPTAPAQQVTTETNNAIAGIPATAEQATETAAEAEAEQLPTALPEAVAEVEPGMEAPESSNTEPDTDSNGGQVVDIGIGIPVQPEVIVIEEIPNETTGDETETESTSGNGETTEQTPDEPAEEIPNEITEEPAEENPVPPTVHPTDLEPESEQQEETTTENPEPLVNVACTASQADIQTSTLQLINDARAVERMCGGVLFEATTPLTWNTKLQDAAMVHSLDMSQNNFFSHDGSDGASAAQRADAQQYDWRSIGENIAAGQQTTELVVQAWLDSPGHCANLMNPKFKETAVVCVEDLSAQYRQYWTNVLGTSF